MTRGESFNTGINQLLLDNPSCREIRETIRLHMNNTSNLTKQYLAFNRGFLPILLYHPSRRCTHIERFTMSLLVCFRLPNCQRRFVQIFNIDRNHFRHTQQAATSGMLKDGYINGSLVGELLDEIYVIRDKIAIDMLIYLYERISLMWITTPYNTLNLKHIVSIEITEITNIIDDAHTHAVDAEYAHREGTATLFTGTLAE